MKQDQVKALFIWYEDLIGVMPPTCIWLNFICHSIYLSWYMHCFLSSIFDAIFLLKCKWLWFVYALFQINNVYVLCMISVVLQSSVTPPTSIHSNLSQYKQCGKSTDYSEPPLKPDYISLFKYPSISNIARDKVEL